MIIDFATELPTDQTNRPNYKPNRPNRKPNRKPIDRKPNRTTELNNKPTNKP